MLNACNSQERTLAQFVALGEAGGWALERVVRSTVPGGFAQLIFAPA